MWCWSLHGGQSAACHKADESKAELELECRGDSLGQPDTSFDHRLSKLFWTQKQPDASSGQVLSKHLWTHEKPDPHCQFHCSSCRSHLPMSMTAC